MARSDAEDLAVFESYRALLVALAYRMLGDRGRAEDMVQEAWLRWQGRREDADSPRAYLVTVVTRLCLNELDSANVRHEESRSDRLPEPIDLDEGELGRLESLDQVSMAFLVVLQRLTPAERAVPCSARRQGTLVHSTVAARAVPVSRSVAASRRSGRSKPSVNRPNTPESTSRLSAYRR